MPKAATPRTFMVRLKRYNKQRGILKRSYTVFGYRFEESKGWYTIDEIITEVGQKGQPSRRINLVDYLRDVHQTEDVESPFAFDVATPEEAGEIDKRERAAAVSARTRARDLLGGASHPNDLTSRETRGGYTEEREDSGRRTAAAALAVPSSHVVEEEDEPSDEDGDLAPPTSTPRGTRGARTKRDVVPLE